MDAEIGFDSLTAEIETWPIAGSFTISRGSKTEAAVVVATLTQNGLTGRGECTPYARYGETVETTRAAILAFAAAWGGRTSRAALQQAMPPGAARNAVDCALWDLEAKRAGRPVWQLAGLPAPRPLITAYTISLGTPEAMAEAAGRAANRPLLKVKLGTEDDAARIAAVRRAAPDAALIVDANEGWRADTLAANLAACAAAGVRLIEQPLPAGQDEALRGVPRLVPLCADESVHDRASLAPLVGLYDAVNIKLDKAGGLTEALAMAAEAEARGLSIMVGCMVATSLSMAPAFLVAQTAQFVDLDGPLLLARDRKDGLRYAGSQMQASPALWGGG